MRAYINKFIKICLGMYYSTQKKKIMSLGKVFGKSVNNEKLKKERE